ncbi:predicted protein [Botrytis cinerea T4]|uniref:Uncharacterized protein n=1 Tax=Botryotinia fuckeliana (strain T4) TaxID=999810 RepID=G2YLN4_BOTF4|nr:predicted protein [Botrytis cinerea T4]
MAKQFGVEQLQRASQSRSSRSIARQNRIMILCLDIET